MLVRSVSEREVSVVALDLPSGHLKTCCGLEPVPKCELRKEGHVFF